MNIGMGEVIIVLLVLALIFGTGKLKFAGKELGSAIKELKSGFKGEPGKPNNEAGSASKV